MNRIGSLGDKMNTKFWYEDAIRPQERSGPWNLSIFGSLHRILIFFEFLIKSLIIVPSQNSDTQNIDISQNSNTFFGLTKMHYYDWVQYFKSAP